MRTIPAVFENGVFRPQTPVNYQPGTRLDLIVPDPDDDAVAILKARFPNSFGGLPDKDAQEMIKAIEEECERVDPDAWK